MKKDKNNIKDVNKSVDEMVRNLSPDEMMNFIEGEIFGEEEIMKKDNKTENNIKNEENIIMKNDNKNEKNIKNEENIIMKNDNKNEKKDGIFKMLWRRLTSNSREYTMLTIMILIVLSYTVYYINDGFNRDERILELSHNYATHNYGNIRIIEERLDMVIDKQNEIIDTVNNLRGGKLWARLFQFGKVKPVTPESIEEEIEGGHNEE